MKFVIFGSCCSVDVFYSDEMKKLPLKLERTFSRSSLITVFSKPSESKIDINSIDSDFQKKMLSYDINKNILDNLVSLMKEEGRYLLFDFLEERFDLLETKCGSLLTFSNEMKKIINLENNDNFNVIDKFSEYKLMRFEDCWREFFNLACENGFSNRIILNKFFLTDKINNGSKFDENKTKIIQKTNGLLSFIYNVVEKDIINIISYPDDILVADSKHKWGLTPFHFVDKFYSFQIKKLYEITERK
ncbi:DUF6270 domain-containing protein [Vibrio metschnikovii]|uniref:DUF6270 domain-containing protein n=2 Tax=Vibrio TaxID=662 RepID=UPI001302DB57|nr:DUF6270 domain-containing protein [Vibrio metschnikovii]